jgi:hypothetical protein
MSRSASIALAMFSSAEGDLPALEGNPVQPVELAGQRVFQQDPAQLALPLHGGLLRAQVAVAELLEKAQRGDLADRGFFEIGGHLAISLKWRFVPLAFHQACGH